ncbi:MAG: lytic murein transglycosylase, partial [Candidatus Staskawiczbacteria bacterium]
DGCPNMSSADCKTLLQQCADYYDQQSAQLAQDLTKTSAQKDTLQNAITKLKNKISGLEADINQSTVMVKDLNIQISDTQVSIDKTTQEIQDSQNQIANILQSVYEEDQKPAFVILLEGNLADFFSNMAYLEGLNSKVSDLLDTTKNLNLYLQGQQVKMGDNVDQLQKTIAIQTLQKQENEQNQQQQNQYLKLTETQYQLQETAKQIADQQSAKIKAMLFQVAGVSQAPTFGQAIAVAQAVANLVTIRPAFLLAIISQESALGKNVGQCLLTNITTGEGKRISSGAYMSRVFKVSRDLKPFLDITASVGRDPLNSPISCDTFGSMGPAQFLPSTWTLFIDRLQKLLGQTPDPWGIKDSFTASALYLSDLGAGAQTATAEATAAYHYNGSGNAARIYSRSVMQRATCIQTFIDNSTMTSDCQSLILGS